MKQAKGLGDDGKARRGHPRMLRGLSIAVAILAVVAALATGHLCCQEPLDAMVERFGGRQASTQPRHFKDMLAYQRRMDPHIPDGAIIFLGDSITQSLAVTAVSPTSINLGIGGETTSLLLHAMPFYTSLHRAGVIVVTIGINDILHAQSDGLALRLREIDRALPAERRVIWNAIMPTGLAKPDGAMRDAIVSANATIKTLCTTRRSCTFVDTWKLFAAGDGGIDQACFLADGIHLSDEGYRRWIPALRAALEMPASQAHRE